MTYISLYKTASSLPALHKNEFVNPGWSTSCTTAAINAAISSDLSSVFYETKIRKI